MFLNECNTEVGGINEISEKATQHYPEINI